MQLFLGRRAGSSFAPSYSNGSRIPKIWNMDTKSGVKFRCDSCGALCGNQPELDNHRQKKHNREKKEDMAA